MTGLPVDQHGHSECEQELGLGRVAAGGQTEC